MYESPGSFRGGLVLVVGRPVLLAFDLGGDLLLVVDCVLFGEHASPGTRASVSCQVNSMVQSNDTAGDIPPDALYRLEKKTDRSYCTAGATATPNSCAASSGKSMSLKIWRAKNTTSASPFCRTPSASCGVVMSPTAPMSRFGTCFLTWAAKGTSVTRQDTTHITLVHALVIRVNVRYFGPTSICCLLSFPPELTSNKSIPMSRSFSAKMVVCSIPHQPYSSF